MKSTTTINSMAMAMLAHSSAAMPAPLRSDLNASSHPNSKGGFALVARQDTVPKCAVPCIQNAIAKVTDCEFTDAACACKYHGKVSAAAQACVVGSCGLQRAITVVVPAVRKMCAKEAAKDVKEDEEEEEEEEDKEEEVEENKKEEEKVKRDLGVEVEDEDEEDEDEENEYEQAKRQLIVPDEADPLFPDEDDYNRVVIIDDNADAPWNKGEEDEIEDEEEEAEEEEN